MLMFMFMLMLMLMLMSQCEPALSWCSPRLKLRVGLVPRILSLRVYDRESFISFHVQVVVPVMLVKPTDTSSLASANISPLTKIPTSLSI